MIINAKTRKLWLLCTPRKTPPIPTLRHLLTHLRKNNIVVQRVRTDEGGELEHSSEFCRLLHNEFNITLETTGSYASWLNGKAERHIQTISNMLRSSLFYSGLPLNLWCFCLEHQATVYNSIHHTAVQDQPHYLWTGTCTNIDDLRI